MKAAVSPATLAIYDRYVKSFFEFAQQFGYLATRIKEKVVRLWLASLNVQGLSYGTICSHLSALRHYCKTLNLPCLFTSPRTNLLLRGIRQSLAVPPRTKEAATHRHVLRLYSAASILGHARHGFRAMITVAFLVSSDHLSFASLRQDISFAASLLRSTRLEAKWLWS